MGDSGAHRCHTLERVRVDRGKSITWKGKAVDSVVELHRTLQNQTAQRRGIVMTRITLITAATLAASLSLAAAFGGPYAGFVIGVVPGPGAVFGAPEDILGEPLAEGPLSGSADVYTLGIGGSVDLQMDTPMYDGPGVDLIVYENSFFLAGTTHAFVEAMHVEVSTDGSTWARFPSAFHGNSGPYSPFAACPVEWYEGLAGVMPSSGGPVVGADPLNVVLGGGDAFDFAWLANEPNVLSGDVDLQVVKFVRLIDIVSSDFASDGSQIWDHGLDSQASADVDALIGVNNGFNGAIAGRPEVEMTLDGAGTLKIRISDSNGFNDVKFGLQASVNGVTTNFYSLLPLFLIVPIDANTVEFVTGPVPTGAIDAVLKVAAVDTIGLTRGDVVNIH